MEYVEKIARKIWITRLCRIEASKRLESNDSFTQTLLVYYSAILTALSIWVFFIEKTNQISDSKVSLILLIASIALTIYSTFIVSKAYKERAIKMKYNYIALDSLYKQIKKLEANYKADTINLNQLIDEVDKVDGKYVILLQEAENHNDCDYIKAINSDKNETLTNYCIARYIYYRCEEVAIKLLGFMGPLISIYFYIKW